MIKDEYKYSELTAAIIGCAMKVHRTLGSGFREFIYQRALEVEFKEAGISFKRELEMPIYYRNKNIGFRKVDFLVNGVVSVELKAKTQLEPGHLNQALNYLEILRLEVGLLINFGEPHLNFKRVINKKISR